MGWLALGAAYSIVYAVIGAFLRPFPHLLPWFRIFALLLPLLAGVAVIVRHRHAWAGCQKQPPKSEKRLKAAADPLRLPTAD